MKKGVTIIICTYNGASRLSRTIEHLAGQSFPDFLSWEVILVDNASSDSSGVLAESEWSKYNIKDVPFHVIREDQPGKLYAIQSGIAKAQYEYFIICDDDNWLNPGYIEKVYSILNGNPSIGAVGGQTMPVIDNDTVYPDWFDAFKEGYAVGKQAVKTGDITYRGHLWGAGLGSRTKLYKDVYKQHPSLLINPHDKKILSTEDTEYCLRLVLKGYRLYYDEDLSLSHFIPKERLTLTYKEGLFKNFENSYSVLGHYYLAVKLYLKLRKNSLNRFRLILITPLRYLFAGSKKKKDEQKAILYYLLPFNSKEITTIHSVIKKFAVES